MGMVYIIMIMVYSKETCNARLHSAVYTGVVGTIISYSSYAVCLFFFSIVKRKRLKMKIIE